MTAQDLLIESIGILGFVANVWANILIARKSIAGWTVRLLANVLWLVFGIAAISIANILSSVVFAGINVYGLRRWRRESREPMPCPDHYVLQCHFCRAIVRQCPCKPGPTAKLPFNDGLCASCKSQLPSTKTKRATGSA